LITINRKDLIILGVEKDASVITHIVDSVVDFVTWLESMEIKGARNKMSLRDSHAFQLSRDPTNKKVIVRSKQWAMSSHWLVSLVCAFFYFYFFLFYFIFFFVFLFFFNLFFFFFFSYLIF
jgi:hypothetical protein